MPNPTDEALQGGTFEAVPGPTQSGIFTSPSARSPIRNPLKSPIRNQINARQRCNLRQSAVRPTANTQSRQAFRR
eukprot:14444357-Alexandrium_andersonii.AAC.1